MSGYCVGKYYLEDEKGFGLWVSYAYKRKTMHGL